MRLLFLVCRPCLVLFVAVTHACVLAASVDSQDKVAYVHVRA